MEKDVEIGIFGGTGIYDSGLLKDAQEIEINTPFGKPSDTITVGILNQVPTLGGALCTAGTRI